MTGRPGALARSVLATRRLLGHRFPPLGLTALRAAVASVPDLVDIELFPGIRTKLDLTEALDQAIFWQGVRYEHPTPSVVRSWLSESGVKTFVDVGANHGFYTLFAAAYAPGVSVHAWEPNPVARARLESAVARNALGSRVTVHPQGLGGSAATMGLRWTDGRSALGYVVEDDARHPVEIAVFDTWLGDGDVRPHSLVAKIDVEGSELGVLRGMERSLAAHAFRGIVVEVNARALGRAAATPDDLRRVLGAHGYVRLPVATTFLGRARSENEFYAPAELAPYARDPAATPVRRA